ncbi:MAG: ADP-ribosylglycohydrolase family protein [Candidatus Riflebacteria bacterium]|nr:ADP-ribosylglycohydrolase family protein [Candidatus Riflebacteria bacterium]
MKQKHVTGCILGTAVGDALGLPYEGLSADRGARMLGSPDRYRFIFGRGMVSDDTEHTCMVAQAIIDSEGDVKRFTMSLARRFRFWLLFVPVGTGFATLRSVFKLWLGFNPDQSGVFSAGNGPAMRAALFGAFFSDHETIKAYIKASTLITHTDPKAEYGSLAVALAALMARQNVKVSPYDYLAELKTFLAGKGEELITLLSASADSVHRGETTREFADSIGLGKGVTGYIYHTVPVAIHCWLRNQQDFRQAIKEIIECGGDADTTAAIVGGIVGCGTGPQGIPREWLDNLCEWPGTVAWMERLGNELSMNAEDKSDSPTPELRFWQILPRNIFVLIVVLLHGFRRLFPPY